MNWARAADVARLRAATKLTQGPILDEDEDVNEIEDEEKNENEVPGGSAWNQKPGLGGSLIWMDSRIHQSTDDDF